MPSSTMAMRHSSGWSTLMSISFFMRSFFLSVAVACGIVEGGVRGRRAGAIGRDGGEPLRGTGQLEVGPDQDVAGGGQVAQAEGVNHLLGSRGAVGAQLEAEPEGPVGVEPGPQHERPQV